MTDHANDPELEHRVASAMRRLADAHEPTPDPAAVDTGRSPNRNWLSIAAVFALLAVGIGGLIFAIGGGRTDSTPADEPAPREGFRSDTPLADDQLVGLDPYPAGRGVLSPGALSTHDQFVRGWEDSAVIGLHDDSGAPTRFVTVVDTAIPPDSFDAASIQQLDGVRYVADDEHGEFWSIEPDRVRGVFEGTLLWGSGRIDASTATEVIDLLDGRDVADLSTNEAFTVIPLSMRLTSVTYGPTNNVDTTITISQYAFDREPTPEQLELIVDRIAPSATTNDDIAFRAIDADTGHPIYVERVTPVDLIVVAGRNGTSQTELDAALANLTIGTQSALGMVDRRAPGGAALGEALLQVEEPWGRWVLAETTNAGVQCVGLQAVVWPDLRSATPQDPCVPAADIGTSASLNLCLDLGDGRVLGLSTGDTPGLLVESSIESGSTHTVRGVDLYAVVAGDRPRPGLNCLDDTSNGVETPATPTTDRTFRFAEPIPTGVVPGLSPAPAAPGTQILLNGSVLRPINPLLDPVVVASLDPSGELVGFASVTDTVIPASSFDSDQLSTVDGLTVLTSGSELPLTVIDGDRVFYVNTSVTRAGDPDPEQARSIARFVVDNGLDALDASPDFEVLPAIADDTTSVRYPTADDAEVDSIDIAVVRFAELIDARTLEFMSLISAPDASLGADGVSYRGRHTVADQPVYVEQVSPVEAVLVMGPAEMTDSEMDIIVASLTFDSADALRLEIEDLGLGVEQVVEIQSDENWGRWAMYSSEQDGQRCFGLDVFVWPQDGSGASPLGCVPLDDAGQTFPGTLCHRFGNSAYVFVVSDDPSARHPGEVVGTSEHEFEGATLIATLYDDPDGDPFRCVLDD